MKEAVYRTSIFMQLVLQYSTKVRLHEYMTDLKIHSASPSQLSLRLDNSSTDMDWRIRLCASNSLFSRRVVTSSRGESKMKTKDRLKVATKVDIGTYVILFL